MNASTPTALKSDSVLQTRYEVAAFGGVEHQGYDQLNRIAFYNKKTWL